MAIQNRRGAYGDFDPSKLLPGEWAVVLSGDTNASDGLACYMCFKAGVVKRMATYEDMIDNIAATSGELIAEEVDRQCKEAIQECKAATNSANIAITNANSAAANAVSVAASAQAAADRANEAAGNIEQANIKPLAYSVSGESITAGNSAEKPLIGLTVHGRADQVSTTGAQLFNKSSVTSESYVRDTDGTVVASTTHPTCASDYITLDGAESIYITSTMTSNRWGAFYNDKKEYVSGIAGYSSPITVPVGAVYIRLTVADDNLDTFMVNTGSTALPYEPYTYGVPSPSVEYPQAIDIAGSGGSINVKVVGANLFDISKVQGISGASGSQTTNNNDGTLLVRSSQGDSSGGYEDGKNVLRDLCPELRVGDVAVLSAKSTGSDKRIYLRGSKSPWTFGISRTISETDLDSIVMFYASGTSTSATISEIMINAGSVALPYEPYKTPQSVSLSTPNGLSGLKVSSGGNYTDESGQQWICDEIVRNERGTGKRIQRIEKNIYTGADNEEWKLHSINSYGIANFYIDFPSLEGIGINNRFMRQTTAIANTETEGFLPEVNRIYIRILSDKASTVDEFKTWLSNHNMTVLTVLPEPVETNLSAEEIASLSALHTYNPTTVITNDSGCDMTAAYVTQYYQGVGDAMFYGVADNLTTEASGTSVLDAHQGKVLDNKIGALADLETTAKSSAVAAINEVKSETVSLIPTVLFNSSESVGNGTFSESIYDFERIRIFYKIRGICGSVDIYTSILSSDSTEIDLIGFFNFNNYLGAHLHRINLSNTTFSTVYAYQYFPPSTEKTDVGGDDAIAIYRVEGYRS